jgi:D-arabinose 1-dehydrogenase-like Zn-dependent alcohol dehydrogenase
MRGVSFLGGRKLQVAEFPDPAPGPHDVVVEIKASGMCGSDLKFYRAAGEETAALGLGKLESPVIAGHEPCGVVAEVGSKVDERAAQIGARVMVHHYSGCGSCQHCRSGWSQMCVAGTTVYGVTAHGAHADYMNVPAHTLVPLPDELSFTTGAAVSCGTGTAYGALRRMNLSGADTIAIVGQGPVGLSATQLAAAMGARVIALDVSPERLARAKAFGADAVVDPKAGDAVAAIKALTHGLGADLTLDTSGAAEGRVIAVRATRPWGTVCFVGEGGEVSLESAAICCANSSRSSARGRFQRSARPTARASSPIKKLR